MHVIFVSVFLLIHPCFLLDFAYHLCEHFSYIYVCIVFWKQPPSSPLWFTRSHSPPTNPTISAAAAASLIMSALTSWRYQQQQQQQFLFQSLRYRHAPKEIHEAPRKIGIICTTTTLHAMHLFQAHCLKLYIKYPTRQQVCFSKIAFNSRRAPI